MITVSRNQKTALASGLAVLLIASFWWNSLASRVSAEAQSYLLSKVQEHMNGKLTISSIDFSMLGSVTAHSVVVSDIENTVIGKSDQIIIQYGLLDALSGRFDMSAVKSIVLENPAITVTSEKDGEWNWQKLVKPDTQGAMDLHCIINVKNGTLLSTYRAPTQLTGIAGSIDLTRYPILAVNLAAKKGSYPISANGEWNMNADGRLTLSSAQLGLSELPLAALGAGEFHFTDGLANRLSLVIAKQAGTLTVTGDADIQNAAAILSGFTISGGSGKVHISENKAVWTDGSALVNGQPITVTGLLTRSDTEMLANFDLSADNFDAEALGSMPLKGGIAFNATIKGIVDHPRAEGSFRIPEGAFGAITFADGKGYFAYEDSTLTLSDTQADAWNGLLTLEGTIIPTTQLYHLAAQGTGMDAGLLTEKDIKGRVNFAARLSGQGSTGGFAEGSFQMGEGSFQSIPFLSMTGNFIKQGEQMRFSNIVVNTIGGSFQAEGFNEGSIVHLKQIGSIVDPREMLTNAVTSKIPDQLRKLLPVR